MPISLLPFDLSPEEREEAQLLLAELELHPDRLAGFCAEVVLLREVRSWAMAHRDRFPPALRAKIIALGNRAAIRRIAADNREEIAP
jgi:hypothetical protein